MNTYSVVQKERSRHTAIERSPDLPKSQPRRKSPVGQHASWDASAWPLLDPKVDTGLLEPDSVEVNDTDSGHQSHRGRSSPEGFWHGGSPIRRPSSSASLHSRSSNMNSSLHGSQDSIGMKEHDYNPDHENETSRGLPQPPVTLGRSQAFACDICGEMIQVKRRREWQSV